MPPFRRCEASSLQAQEEEPDGNEEAEQGGQDRDCGVAHAARRYAPSSEGRWSSRRSLNSPRRKRTGLPGSCRFPGAIAERIRRQYAC